MAKSSAVLSFYDILLQQSDLDLLDGPYWLNDTIISFCFEYFEKILFGHSKDFLFVSPEVTQCIKMVSCEEVKAFLDPLGMKKKQLVFFALNDNDRADVAGGSHWSLLVFSKPENKCFHIDSSQMHNDGVAWRFIVNLTYYIRQEISEVMEFVDKESVQQTNGYDCGIHLICNAERLAAHASNHGEIGACDLMTELYPSEKRKEIAAIIMSLTA